MAVLLEGKTLAARSKAEVSAGVAKLKEQGIAPCLAVVVVGESAAGQLYVKGKQKDCAECGVLLREIRLSEDISQEALLAEIAALADDDAVHGILVQLPLPKQIDDKAVIDAIPASKDVDGFSPVNVGRMVVGETCYMPCTAAACMDMIHSTGIEIEGKHVAVIGRSNIVGKPVSILLLQANATVTICHTKTENLKEICASADILVSAVGHAGLVTGDMVKEGAIVIDAGINRTAEGKVCGDVVFEEAVNKAAYISPVPGGVGLMTRAMLMKNILQAATPKK